jgi:hypothetical protein
MMAADRPAIWLVAGVRTPFVGVDGPFAHRDSLSLSVPVVQAMAARMTGSIDFAVWGAVAANLAYGNLAREVWLESKLDPHAPTFTTVMQCSTSMVGVFEAAGMMDPRASHRGGAECLLFFDYQPLRSSPVSASPSTCPTGIACRAFDHRPAAASHAA